jgi:hypothetical protein
LLVLIHLHGVGRLRRSILLRLGLNLGSLGSLSLLANGLGLLLLLNSRGRGSSRRRSLEVHRWYKGLRKFLLRDKWMQLGLLRRPTLQGVYVEQTSDKVDEGNTVVELCETC